MMDCCAFTTSLKSGFVTKRCKDKSLVGTVKETIQQVSMSKKWASKPALDENGEPILSSKGKPILKKSYSVLQDDFFRYMRDAGYDDVERGERGSSEEHLTVTQFKVQQEQARLAERSRSRGRDTRRKGRYSGARDAPSPTGRMDATTCPCALTRKRVKE